MKIESSQAAHCVQGKSSSVRLSRDAIIVKLGKYDLSKHERRSATKFVSEIVIHPDWDSASRSYNADVAIIRLESKVAAGTSASPICLWDEGEPSVEKRGVMAGWGPIRVPCFSRESTERNRIGNSRKRKMLRAELTLC